MIALVVDTVYQLMSGIYLSDSLNKKEDIVLFLNKAWQQTKRGFDLKKDNKNIKAIYFYGEEHMKPMHLLTSLMSPKKMLKSIDGYDFSLNIDTIIAPRTGWFATYLYKYLTKEGKTSKMLLIEEGLGEYNEKMPETRFTAMVHKLRSTCHTDHIDEAYFAAPTLYPYDTDFPIKKLYCDFTSTVTDSLISTFKAEDDIEKLRQYNYLYLSQTCGMGEFEQPYREAEEKMAACIKNTLHRDDFAIKMHPRNDHFESDGVPCIYSQCPFELYAAKEDMDKKVLISTFSTAMLTPKFLFDKEPYLIFTYLLADDILRAFSPTVEKHENNIAFIKNGAALYKNKDRVFFPRNYDEFEEVLKTVSKFI